MLNFFFFSVGIQVKKFQTANIGPLSGKHVLTVKYGTTDLQGLPVAVLKGTGKMCIFTHAQSIEFFFFVYTRGGIRYFTNKNIPKMLRRAKAIHRASLSRKTTRRSRLEDVSGKFFSGNRVFIGKSKNVWGKQF